MYLNSYFINLDVGHFFDTVSNIANMNLNRYIIWGLVRQVSVLQKNPDFQINDMVAKGLVNE